MTNQLSSSRFTINAKSLNNYWHASGWNSRVFCPLVCWLIDNLGQLIVCFDGRNHKTPFLVDLHSPTDRQKILHRVTKLWWIRVAVKYRFPSRYFAFFRIPYRTAWSNHGSGKYNSKPWFDFGFEQLLHLPLSIQLCFSQFLHLVHGFPSLCLSQNFWCDHLDT